MTHSSVAHETFVIERTYEAPVAQVYRAWAEPKLKARWFAGSVDALDADYSLDFRVGGHEMNKGGPHEMVYIYDSEFRDIVPEERIVYTYEMYAGEDRISVSVATVEFHADGDKTRLILTEQGVFFNERDTSAQREEGTGHLLESLEAFLSEDDS